jgi:hypothetical protein
VPGKTHEAGSQRDPADKHGDEAPSLFTHDFLLLKSGFHSPGSVPTNSADFRRFYRSQEKLQDQIPDLPGRSCGKGHTTIDEEDSPLL